MVGRILAGVMLSVVSLSSSANIKVYIAPDGWQRSTDSTDEIRDYLRDISDGKVNKDESMPEDLATTLDHYRDKVQIKAGEMFNRTELERYNNTICKISVTSARTFKNELPPTEVVTLDQLADNTKPACASLTQKLKAVINPSTALKYPYSVKDAGLMSINMIFYFQK